MGSNPTPSAIEAALEQPSSAPLLCVLAALMPIMMPIRQGVLQGRNLVGHAGNKGPLSRQAAFHALSERGRGRFLAPYFGAFQYPCDAAKELDCLIRP